MRKVLWVTLLVLVIIFVYRYFNKPVVKEISVILPGISVSPTYSTVKPGIIADKLQIPWSLVFLPDKSILFTERSGRLRKIDSSGKLLADPVSVISDVKTIGEGGLLGVTIHPKYSENHYIYLYYTYAGDENKTLNKVVRYVYNGTSLSDQKIIVDNIPGNTNHDGGRIKFGPDGYLYITTGDSLNPSLAQNTNALAGKILRVKDDGSPADGNPFQNLVYSYGHRNPEGIVWDDQGRLWSTEHGNNAGDEINLIEKGKNYGWPTIARDQTNSGMENPVKHSGNDTWAPSGVAFVKPYLFFGGLRSMSLYRFNTETKQLDRFLQDKYGRIRDVVLGQDGFLYITTSNMDGRTLTHLDGDKIIRVDPNHPY